MDLEYFRMLNIEFLDKDPDVVPEQAPLIILGRKSGICVDNHIKYNKRTINIDRRINLVRNGKEFNLHKKVWYNRGMQL